MKPTNNSGVALVVTLIMLSLVTFLTVAFLSVARRERSSMLVSQSQTDAKNAADSALAYAQSAILAQMFQWTNAHNYGLMISTNVDTAGGSPAALATLQFLPRAPVYAFTNNPFFLDLNRNGQYETNGGYPNYVGDPEWIGILEYPNIPHGPTNRFVGRIAYIVLPASKSLDFNFIHNQAKRPAVVLNEGYLRNQGVGSWEFNLAAFLNELNVSVWSVYNYQTAAAAQSLGISFTDARDLLTYRYNADYNNLQTVNQAFPTNNFAFQAPSVDGLSDGPLMLGSGFPSYLVAQQDNSTFRFPGGENLNAAAVRYYDVLEMFTPGRSYNSFMGRLTNSMSAPSGDSNNYTFYNLISQLGVDSEAPKHRMNLNFTNDYNASANSATNLVPWTAVDFFTNAADLMIKASIVTNYVLGPIPATNFYFGGTTNYPIPAGFNFGITNIPVYPFSYYTPEIHRLLQVSANIYDAAANSAYPSVFRPIFKFVLYPPNPPGYIAIVGYKFEPDSSFLLNIGGLTNLDWSVPAEYTLLTNAPPGAYHVRGVPFILGARKGFPNFNEFAMQTVLTATRKLQISKPFSTNAFMAPTATNQMIIYGISNRFFMEAWNSYQAPYLGVLQMTISHIGAISLTNQFTNLTTFFTNPPIVYNITNWPGNTYTNIALNTINFMTNSVFLGGTNNPLFLPLPYNKFLSNNFEVPDVGISVTNWLRYALIDKTPFSANSNRLVDYVNFGSLNDGMDINGALVGISNRFAGNSPAQFWLTNRFGGPTGLTWGISNQVKFASTALSASNSLLWVAYNNSAVGGTNINWEVGKMQQFLTGQNQFGYRYSNLGTNLQVPFTPTIKVYRDLSWEVNDPMVHTLASDLFRPAQTNVPPSVRPPRSPIPPPGTGGYLNTAHKPWGGNPRLTNVTYQLQDYDLSLKDPGIRRSDDWQFPAGAFANVGWLGQVHRGTPWQTLYMKSAVAKTNDWYRWANTYETHPTNDWKLFGLFTVAVNDNAARGTLSINQTNRAAWSALFGGVQVLSNNNQNVTISPNSTQLTYLVDGINKIRSQMLPAGAPSFTNFGDILRVPHLTTSSPFIDYGVPLWDANVNYNNGTFVVYEGKIYFYYQAFPSSNRPPDVNLTYWGPVNQVTPQMMNLTDFTYERIPMQTLSLMNLEEEPRMVIYAYGQSLRPAERSVQIAAFGPTAAYRGMATNYNVTGEVLIRSVVRVRNAPRIGQPGPFYPQIVVESYDILPSD